MLNSLIEHNFACVSLNICAHSWVQVPMEDKRGCWIPGTWVTQCGESNPGPVQEQEVFLATELSLQTPRLILYFWIFLSAPLITSCTECLNGHSFIKYFNTLKMCFSTIFLVNYTIFLVCFPMWSSEYSHLVQNCVIVLNSIRFFCKLT